MLHKRIFGQLTLLLLVFSSSCFSQGMSAPEKEKKVLGAIKPKVPTKEEILGSILGGALQTMHFSQKKIDDDLSKNAFKFYVERLDYSKQFLLKSDVKKLEKYKNLMSNELRVGKLDIVDESVKILSPRIKMLSKYVDQLMKKPFSFTEKEYIESDAKKREFLSSEKELKERWRKQLKLETLAMMLEKKDEQDGVNKDKKKKDKNKNKSDEPVKKLSMKELEAESRDKVYKRYKKYFKRLLEEDRSDRLDKFYNSFTRVFDPHTNYLIPEDKEDFDIDMSGQLQGIGALLREEGSYIKVERIIPGSASWKGKELEAEDIILAVGQNDDDPVDVVDMNLRDAVKMIRGPKGTTVKLTVKKPDGTTTVIPIVRDVVVIEESYAKSSVLTDKKSKKKIGYIFLPKFYRDFSARTQKNCTDDVRAEIIKLKEKGVEALILDLRNNGGGALEDARLMSGLFIKKGPIVQVKSSNGSREVLADTDAKVEFAKPLIVMVNRFSASASEILAAAMQDYERAVIVGTSEGTHGKGTVQALIDLDNYASPLANPYKPLGALKITIQMFYRVTGGSTQFKGVTPDITLPDPFAYVESGESSLDYALPYQEVASVDFDKWERYTYPISKLKKNSKERVKKNKYYSQVASNLKWFMDRKEKTQRPLNLDEMANDRKMVREKSDEFKNDEEIKSFEIEALIQAKDDVGKELKENFIETLRTDPAVEETIQVALDILQAV